MLQCGLRKVAEYDLFNFFFIALDFFSNVFCLNMQFRQNTQIQEMEKLFRAQFNCFPFRVLEGRLLVNLFSESHFKKVGLNTNYPCMGHGCCSIQYPQSCYHFGRTNTVAYTFSVFKCTFPLIYNKINNTNHVLLSQSTYVLSSKRFLLFGRFCLNVNWAFQNKGFRYN